MKASGLGRTHGRAGLEEMVRQKYVARELVPSMKKIWWFGYGDQFPRQMNHFVDALFASSFPKRLRGWMGAAQSLWRKQL
jgi:hypothetical protein